MSDREKKEQEIMNQEMSADEMETVAGGRYLCMYAHEDSHCKYRNSQMYGRPIKKPDGTFNCAYTVEDGSHCDYNDACYGEYVRYLGLTFCGKAWE